MKYRCECCGDDADSGTCKAPCVFVGEGDNEVAYAVCGVCNAEYRENFQSGDCGYTMARARLLAWQAAVRAAKARVEQPEPSPEPVHDDDDAVAEADVEVANKFLALIGAASAKADFKIAQHTVCADCELWQHSTTLPCVHTPPDGPLWPGCRAFKHRPGTPGPMARWKDALKREYEEARARYRKARAEKESDG